MRILIISLFHPELIRGGAQQVAYEHFIGLRERDDCEVFLLSSTDNSYPALFKSGARITGFDGRENEFLFLSRDYDYFWQRTASGTLLESFAEFLRDIRPDVVHVHHFLTFGVDLLSLIRRTLPEARIVFTLHEFLAICAADGHMLRKNDRTLCEKASSIRCHQCFPETRPETFFLREMWIKKHFESVDVFTTPTRFMRQHFIDWGLSSDKIRYVTNGQKNQSGGKVLPPASEKRNRFGFFGQLVDVKGVQVILQAVEQLRGEGFEDFVIELNGDNLRYASESVRKSIESFLAAEAERPLADQIVIMNGAYNSDQLPQRMARIDWTIVPSIWWEIFGLVISEAWMFGRPVLASNVGGPAERIVDGKNGLHFPPNDAVSLARLIKRCVQEEGLWDRLHAQITPPPERELMLEGFLEIYREPAEASADATALPLAAAE